MARIPRPTKMKILNGEPNKNRINRKEPQPISLKTTCPAHLKGSARSEWKRITPELEAMGLFSKIDRAALAAYCQAYGGWVEVSKRINEIQDEALKANKDSTNAYLLKTQAGNVIISPLLSVRNRFMEQMRQFLSEFGMTPVSRSRINIEKESKEDDLDKFLNTGKMN